MVSSIRISWKSIVVQALAAGIVGAALIDLDLWATTVLPAHGTMLGFWQFIASVAMGKVAFTSTAYAFAGLAIHVVVSVGWAGGYAYLAALRPYLNARWAISGIAYGLVVYLVMQLMLVAANSFSYPTSLAAFGNVLVAHALFFGLPVAFVVRTLQPRVAA